MERAKPTRSPGVLSRVIISINLPTMKRILVILFAIVFFEFCIRVPGTCVNESGGLYDQIVLDKVVNKTK